MQSFSPGFAGSRPRLPQALVGKQVRGSSMAPSLHLIGCRRSVLRGKETRLSAMPSLPAGRRDARQAVLQPPPHVLTVDVEHYFQEEAFAGYVNRESWDQWPYRLYIIS